MKKIRIGTGSGYWGDRFDAVDDLVKSGNVNYLAFDYLAELTMSILQKQKNKDPRKGYATDFLEVLLRILPECCEKKIRMVASAGGVNPEALGAEIVSLAKSKGLKVKVAMVLGDNIFGSIDSLMSQGCNFENMETREAFASVKSRISNANVYLGAEPIVQALQGGADIVITGRNTDTSLFLGPMIHEFGWKPNDLDRLASGIAVGHIIECGGQVTGGNFSGGWKDVPNLENLGWPIAEVYENGEAIITKPEGTGGLVCSGSVKEELLYEIGDPTSYITPDVVADFSKVFVEDVGPNKVKVWGSTGKKAPETLKVSMGYSDGYKISCEISYAWPEALQKAKLADKILRSRMDKIRLKPLEIWTEYIGHNSIMGPISEREAGEPEEVRLRLSIRTKTAKEAEMLAIEVPCMVTAGPPHGSGYNLGRSRPVEILAYWPCLVPARFIKPEVKFVE